MDSLVRVIDALGGNVAEFALQVLVPDGSHITVTAREELHLLHRITEGHIFKLKDIRDKPKFTYHFRIILAQNFRKRFLKCQKKYATLGIIYQQ